MKKIVLTLIISCGMLYGLSAQNEAIEHELKNVHFRIPYHVQEIQKLLSKKKYDEAFVLIDTMKKDINGLDEKQKKNYGFYYGTALGFEIDIYRKQKTMDETISHIFSVSNEYISAFGQELSNSSFLFFTRLVNTLKSYRPYKDHPKMLKTYKALNELMLDNSYTRTSIENEIIYIEKKMGSPIRKNDKPNSLPGETTALANNTSRNSSGSPVKNRNDILKTNAEPISQKEKLEKRHLSEINVPKMRKQNTSSLYLYEPEEDLDIQSSLNEALKYAAILPKIFGIDGDVNVDELSALDFKINDQYVDSLYNSGFLTKDETAPGQIKDHGHMLEILNTWDSEPSHKISEKIQIKIGELDSLEQKGSFIHKYALNNLIINDLLLNKSPDDALAKLQGLEKEINMDSSSYTPKFTNFFGFVNDTNFLYAQLYSKKGEYQKALEHGLKFAEKYTEMGLIMVPIIYMGLQDYSNAEIWYNKAITNGGYVSLFSHIGLAGALLGMKKYKEAIQVYLDFKAQIDALVLAEPDKQTQEQYEGLTNEIAPTIAFSYIKMGQLAKANALMLPYLKYLNKNNLYTTVFDLESSYNHLPNDSGIVYKFFSNKTEIPFLYLAERNGSEDEHTAEGYNSALVYKESLLNSNKTLVENAFKDNNLELKQLYLKWIDAREKATDVNFEQRDEQLNYANFYRNKIISKQKNGRKEYSINNLDIDWKRIQNSLGTDEAAIEFVSYNSSLFETTNNSRRYGAFILTRHSKYPYFVELFKESDLLNYFEIGIQSSNIKHIYTEQGQSLYDAIWKPIDKNLSGIKTVYYSPTGILHDIAFSALPTEQKGSLLLDKYRLVQMGSTKNLVDDEELRSPQTALVIGGLSYNYSNKVKKAVSKLIIEERGRYNRNGWAPLKGTIEEVETIASLLEANGIRTSKLIGAEGLEDKFYITVKERPDILHIATHAFYKKKGKEDVLTLSNALGSANFKDDNDVMNWSGLVFSGANYYWKKGEKIKPEIEDGIVTANEIASLDLRNTELVVLSACETGIGKSLNNEGASGLQRGLKMAGAKNLLVSLWKVDDKITKEYMILFYDFLIDKRQSIQQAYQNTQKTIRQKHPDPYHWAGFVLIQ